MWLTIAIPVLVHIAACGASSYAPWATALSRTGWTVRADSAQSGHGPGNVLDGNNNTFWQATTNLPHTITIDMKKSHILNGISYLPRQDTSNGYVGQHSWSVSNDGKQFTTVIFGNYDDQSDQKTTYFTNIVGRYVRLVATSSQSHNQQISAAEIKVYSPNPSASPAGFRPPPPHTSGRWDVTIDIPLVPAAGAVSRSGTLVFWSAWRPYEFLGGGGTGETDTALWNPASHVVSPKLVTQTGHDMFCPGISLDVHGRIVVSGGITAKDTSRYDSSTGWTRAAPMAIGRGYQSSVTIGDGRIFTIGGSWSGGVGGKNGEIYNPATNIWSNRSGCAVAPMLTHDKAVTKRDNHAWLFAWKSNSIFQAGPSSAMHWYNVSGTRGSWVGAGKRASDPDSMCGNAVMYNAIAGKIFTLGGSRDYAQSPATSNAHIITLGNPGSTRTSVATIRNANYARVFANSVVLPDGKILIVGGQSYALPFTDTTPQFVPELFDPATLSYSKMARIAVPRNYHSIALLLPDGRVLSGGGGLCPLGCLANHFDAQIYSPPYLFTSTGAPAPRPVIKSLSSSTLRHGTKFTANTSGGISAFSLIRLGSATHTVDTDQRRIPLTPAGGGPTYTLTVPSDPGVAVPGYWFLFAVNRAGVPSVAKIVQITL